MRFKGKKWASPFFIISLAIAGLFGVTAGVLNKQVRETPVMEKTDAASTSGSATIWFSWSGSWGVDPYVSYCVGSDTWTHMTTKCATSGTSGIGSVDVPDNTTKVIFAHRSSDAQSWWGQTSNIDITIDSTNGLKNQLNITCNSSSFGASWGYNTGLSNTIQYNNNSGSGTIANQQIWLDNATLSNGSGFSRTGYTLSSWNTKANGTGTSYSLGGSATYKNFPNYVNGSTVILYAQWTVKTYTMTFKPNGGTGSEVTRTKTHGTPFTVPTPESLGIGAGAARVMLSWNANQDGSGTSYKIDGTSTYSGNSAQTFWLQQGFKSYEYSVDGGSTWVQMPQTTTATDCVATYASDASNYLPAGQAITIRGYYGDGTHTIQNIDVWTGNQYWDGISSHCVSIGTHNKMVLYVTNGGSFNLDVWGGSERGIAIEDSTGFVTKYECNLNETTHNYTGTITVHYGDRIEAFYNYATVYTITMTGYSSFGIDVNGNVTVPAVYVLTLTWDGTDGGYPTVNVDSMVAADTAKLIAQTFIADITPICTSIEGGSAPSTLVSTWTTEAGYYAKLTTATQNILNGTASSSDTDVVAMQAKYDRVVGKYKESVSGINDYMSRNPARIYSLGTFSPFSLMNNDENSLTTVIIIVASSVSLLSITALSILLVKKRKRKEY